MRPGFCWRCGNERTIKEVMFPLSPAEIYAMAQALPNSRVGNIIQTCKVPCPECRPDEYALTRITPLGEGYKP